MTLWNSGFHDSLCNRLISCLPTAYSGQTPLLAAAQNGQTEVVDELIKSGANPDAEADHGVRALHRLNRKTCLHPQIPYLSLSLTFCRRR